MKDEGRWIEPVCEICGRKGSERFAGRYICMDCYQEAGSCCQEFGAADLWETEGQEQGEDDAR